MRAWVAAGMVACAAPASVLPTPTPSPWVPRDDVPVLDVPWFADHGVDDLSTFGQTLAGPSADRPGAGHRGAFGVGNGNAFALMGLTDPVNALHEVSGPLYRRGARYFGDMALRLVVDGAVVPTVREAIGRPRGTALVVTRADLDGDGGTLWTVDVAPRPAGVAPEDVPPVIVRFAVVRAGSATAAHALRIDSVDTLSTVDGVLAATVPQDGRLLGAVPWQGAFALQEDGAGWLDLPALAPGEVAVVPMAFVTAWDADDLADTVADVRAADPETWLSDTLAWWHAWSSQGLQLDVDDPVLTDLLDAIRVTVRVQQSPAGGVSPMSRYTGVWLRDSIGPARMFARLGLTDDARAAVAYLELCHRGRGDYSNACDSGLLPGDVTREVDWDALPPFSGRTAAEGPSYVPLAWREVVRWTGETEDVTSRWSYLRRAILAQSMTEDGLQPWSGDETFRLAMNVAFGEALEVPWQDTAWSSNSAHVLIPAARFLAGLAEAAGHADDAAALTERAERSRQGLVDHFLRPEGHFAALILRDPEATPLDLPFEDSNLKALWTGAFAADDPVALANLDALLAVAGRGDGSVQSRPGPGYSLGGDLSEGVATGMVPGFVLWNLMATGHPEGPAAFDQLYTYASPSGAYHEGLLYGDRQAFQPLYDGGGVLGDVAARYRPWEGGIDGDALVAWVVGAEPWPLDAGPGLRLRPHVPHGLDHLGAGPITAPGVVADLDVTWADGWTVTVTSSSDAPFGLDLELPLGLYADPDGVLVADGPSGPGVLTTWPRGERVVVFPTVDVPARGEVVFTVR